MTAVVFHYTDSAHLPFIADDAELRPSQNRVGVGPGTDFLWASSSPHGDRTQTFIQSARGRELYETGHILRVKIELPQDAFFPWSEVESHFPEWTKPMQRFLEKHKHAEPKTWWCRHGSHPINEATPIYVRDWRTPWRRIMLSHVYEQNGFDDIKALRIGDYLYGSQCEDIPGKPVMYKPFRQQLTAANGMSPHEFGTA